MSMQRFAGNQQMNVQTMTIIIVRMTFLSVFDSGCTTVTAVVIVLDAAANFVKLQYKLAIIF